MVRAIIVSLLVCLMLAASVFAGSGGSGAVPREPIPLDADPVIERVDQILEEEGLALTMAAEGFFPSPETYVKGQTGDLTFTYTSEPVSWVTFQVWHLETNRVEGAISDMEPPWVYPASELDTVSDGRGSIQALLRGEDGKIFKKVDFYAEFTDQVGVDPLPDDPGTWPIPAPGPTCPCDDEKPTKIDAKYFTDISGSKIVDMLNDPAFPNNPAYALSLDYWEIPEKTNNYYGTLIQGYLIPPVTGDYIFWITGDDNSVVSISPTMSPSDMVEVASVPGWTKSREFDKYPEQQSLAVYLEEGKKYYIETVHKEGHGGDNLALFWEIPGENVRKLIHSDHVEPYLDDRPPGEIHFVVDGISTDDVVQGEIPVTVTGSDPAFVVDRVTFTIPGFYDKTENYDPFSMNGDSGWDNIVPWDSTTLDNGAYELHLEVMYENEKIETTVIPFMINNPSTMPLTCDQMEGAVCTGDQTCPGNNWLDSSLSCCASACQDPVPPPPPTLPPLDGGPDLPPLPPPPGMPGDEDPGVPDLVDVSSFVSEPATITIGEASDLEVIIGNDYINQIDNIIFQVFTASGSFEASHTATDSNYVYPASVINTATAGPAEVQALLRDQENQLLIRLSFDTVFEGGIIDDGGIAPPPGLPPPPPPPSFG